MSKKLNLSMFALVLVAMCMSFTLQAQGCDAMKAVKKKYDEIFAEKNADRLGEVYHADAVRTISGEKLDGLEAIQNDAVEFYKSIPDAVGTEHEVMCSGNFLVVRWSGTGTPAGAPGAVNVTGITIYEFADGKIKNEWEEFSDLSLMRQLGFEIKPPGGGN